MRFQIKTQPSEEPVTIAEIKIHLHMDADQTAEDTLLTSLITAARSYVEQYTGRALVTQTWYGYLDQFPGNDYINIPFGNLDSVTSVKTIDSAGDEITLTVTTQYLVDSDSEPGRVVLPYSVSWPSITPYPVNPIVIEFVCGYGLAVAVPDGLKSAIKLIVGDLYEHREAQIETGSFQVNETVQNLMFPYRLWDNY